MGQDGSCSMQENLGFTRGEDGLLFKCGVCSRKLPGCEHVLAHVSGLLPRQTGV